MGTSATRTFSPLTSVARADSSSIEIAGAAAPVRACAAFARRFATRSGTLSGCVRSSWASPWRMSSWRRMSATPSGPVSASMRRTFAALEDSETTLNRPISAVERTCVPPHSSRENDPSPTSTIRTTSPYFSPNSAMAPNRRASSSVVVSARTGWSSRIQSLTRSSTSRSSSSLSAPPWVKSKRSLSGPT